MIMHPLFNKFLSFTALTTCLVSLSGCDSFRSTFGLDHYQPDEFKVSDNPPLSIPKDYKLRPPANDGGNNIQTTTRADSTSGTQAQNLLLGTSASGAPKGTGEQTLLSMANAQQQSAPNIRETVNKEAAVTTNVSDSLIQRITGWKEEFSKNVSSINDGQQPSQADPVVAEQKVD